MASTTCQIRYKEGEIMPMERPNTAVSDSNDDAVIYLNIGGEKITTKRSTLCQVNGSWLAAMFSGRWEEGQIRDKDGFIFLDFNPKFFKLILDYLRERSLATDDEPPCIPKLPQDEQEAFKRFVNYLGLGEELCFVQEPVVLSCVLKSLNAIILGPRTVTAEPDEWEFVLSDNTYTNKGSFCWEFFVSYVYGSPIMEMPVGVFVGILKDDPDVYEPLLLEDSRDVDYGFEPYHPFGSYGWIVEPGVGCTSVVDGFKPVPNHNFVLNNPHNLVITLDFQTKKLYLALENGQQAYIPLPSDARSTIWRLYICFNKIERMEVLS